MCLSTTKKQKQPTAVRVREKSTMALPSIMNAWPSFGGQGSSPHLSSLQSAHQMSVWNPAPSGGTNYQVHNTTHLHTSNGGSPPVVQQADSPADSQSPALEEPSPALNGCPVKEENTPLTPSLMSEVPTTPISLPAGSGSVPTISRSMSFPSSNLSGVLKKPKRTRRKRCLECEGCRRKDNCGVCSVCTNPNSTNTVCKKRRCELLKTRPVVAPTTPTSTPVTQMMMESPKREPSQTPPITFSPVMNGFNFPSSIASSPVKDETVDFKPPIARKRKRNGSQVYRPPQKEPPPCGCQGSEEGIYYTHLGASSSPEELRLLLEKRFSVTGNQLRLIEIQYTGYEAKTAAGCPTAEWVVRRSSKEELFLIIYRHHKGHTCNAPYTVVSIVLWEGLSQARSLQLYQQLTDLLPKYGCPTHRKCEKNENKSCLCQGKDEETRGYSYSFGCSWSVYYNGCKFARSKFPRKFKLQEQSQEEALESTFQSLATDLAPVYKWLAPDSFQNQANTQNDGHECRLGYGDERPFSGVTCCMDFCAHSHYDRHNMANGGSTVVCTILRKGVLKDDPEESEQIHVLPLYRLKDAPEKSTPGVEVRPVEADNSYEKMSTHVATSGQQSKSKVHSPMSKALVTSSAQTKQPGAAVSGSTVSSSSSEGQHQSGISQPTVDTATSLNRTTPSTSQPPSAMTPPHPHTTTQTPELTQTVRPPLPPLALPGSSPLHPSTPTTASTPKGATTPVGDLPSSLVSLAQQHHQLGTNGFHRRPSLNGLTRLNGFGHHPMAKVIKQEMNGHPVSPMMNGYAHSPQLHDLSGGNTSSTDSDSDCYILTDSPTPSQPSSTPPRPPSALTRAHTPDSLLNHHHIKSEFAAAVENGRTLNGFLPHRPQPPPYLNFRPPTHQFNMTHQLQRSQSFTLSPGLDDTPRDESQLSTPSKVSPSQLESYTGDEDASDEAEDLVSDRINASPGGVGIALGHGSILIECAKKELHATTPIKNPCRTMPTRISMVFYQHKNMTRRHHGWYEEVEKAKKRQEEQQRVKMLRTQDDLLTGRFVHYNPPHLSPVTPHRPVEVSGTLPLSTSPPRLDESAETDSEYCDVFETFFPMCEEDDQGVVAGKVPRAEPFSQYNDNFYLELPVKQVDALEAQQTMPLTPPPLFIPCRYVSSPTSNKTTITTSACKPKDVFSGNWSQSVSC